MPVCFSYLKTNINFPQAITLVIPRLPPPESVPLRWILLAIAVGLLCITIIVVCLWRSGFFKRTRIDPVLLQETIEKANEVRASVNYRMSSFGRASMQPRFSMMQRMSFQPHLQQLHQQQPLVESPTIKQRIRYSAFLENEP